MLAEALQSVDSDTRQSFFDILCLFNSCTPQAAGNIFENWFHTFFSAGRTIKCNWIQGRGIVSLQGQTKFASMIWDVLKDLDPPYLWIAPKDFEGLDSILVLKTCIYAFQVTIGPTNRSPIEGMKMFQENLSTALKKLP